jgi:hypothetical protein
MLTDEGWLSPLDGSEERGEPDDDDAADGRLDCDGPLGCDDGLLMLEEPPDSLDRPGEDCKMLDGPSDEPDGLGTEDLESELLVTGDPWLSDEPGELRRELRTDDSPELRIEGSDDIVLDSPSELEPTVLCDDGWLSPLDVRLDGSEENSEPGDDDSAEGRLDASLDFDDPLGWDD